VTASARFHPPRGVDVFFCIATGVDVTLNVN